VVVDVVLNEVLEDWLEVCEFTVVEGVHAFCAGKFPALFPESLDAAGVPVVFGEEVAEDPGAVGHVCCNGTSLLTW